MLWTKKDICAIFFIVRAHSDLDFAACPCFSSVSVFFNTQKFTIVGNEALLAPSKSSRLFVLIISMQDWIGSSRCLERSCVKLEWGIDKFVEYIRIAGNTNKLLGLIIECLPKSGDQWNSQTGRFERDFSFVPLCPGRPSFITYPLCN